MSDEVASPSKAPMRMVGAGSESRDRVLGGKSTQFLRDFEVVAAKQPAPSGRRLEVEYPPGFDSHCHRETFYIDDRGLIRRHDYLPDVFAEARVLARLLPIPLKAAHFTGRHREVDGLIFPTFRRVMLAPPELASFVCTLAKGGS